MTGQPNCGGRNYLAGCTCGDCHTRYLHDHAHACSYGLAYEARRLLTALKTAVRRHG